LPRPERSGKVVGQLGTKAYAYFDASHTVAGDEFCSGDHGHTFRATAHVSGLAEFDMSGILRVQGAENLHQELARISLELDGRNLNAMMLGAQTTPESIASWILERIPSADWVEVEMGWRHQTGRAERDKKR